MTGNMDGSWRIFRALGIDVYVHWSWFIALMIFFQLFGGDNPLMFLFLFGTLFGVVVLHEYGHALACRSVGGRVGHIVLWPLGGIAFVQPPPRPSALLWTIAAGPLVNLALIPAGIVALLAAGTVGASDAVLTYLNWFIYINGLLFVFNMMPAYPLDGGQILQAILWYFMPRGRAIYISSAIGLVFGGVMVAFGLMGHTNPEIGRALPITPLWMAILGAFITWEAYKTLQVSRGST